VEPNRVKDYYETIVMYTKLAEMTRYIIVGHFSSTSYRNYLDKEEEEFYTMFRKVLNQNRYLEFSSMVRNKFREV
jgi:hypothetical protein